MKIIHVIRSLDPSEGGPPQVVVRLAAAQAHLGHEVHVLAYGNPRADGRIAEQLAQVPHRELLHLHQLPHPTRAERVLARAAARTVAALLGGADWFHMHGIWEPILKVAAQAAFAGGVGYCFRPAGMLDPWSLRQRRWKKKLAMMLGVRRVLGRAAFIHTLNPDEGELLAPLRLGVPTEIIPNGIFFEEFDPLPPRDQFRADCPSLGNRPFVLFLSRLHYKKGLDLLADAFASLAPRHPDVDLVVAGPDDGSKADFERRISEAGLTARVHLVGPLYGVQKRAALAACDCFTLPSRQEGFSVAVLEAMAAGAPVVVSDACHFPDIETEGAGFVVPLRADALGEAIEKVLNDPDRRRFGRAGRSLVERKYTWERAAELAVAAYQRVIAHQ
jgi:glycosyltransferase involved in cell wall biosynthesis